jgi:hypothetical protein
MCHLLEESFHPSCIEKTKHLHSENQLFLLIPGRKHILFVTLSVIMSQTNTSSNQSELGTYIVIMKADINYSPGIHPLVLVGLEF